jgi:hypothetical protein
VVSGVTDLKRFEASRLVCEADTSHVNCTFQCEERVSWKRDVALEISVDVENVPAMILLSGTLDGDTAVNLMALVAELIDEGYRSFELRTSALCVANEPGLEALQGIRRLVQRSGGNIAWNGLTANHPFPTENDRLDQERSLRCGSRVPAIEDARVRLLQGLATRRN